MVLQSINKKFILDLSSSRGLGSYLGVGSSFKRIQDYAHRREVGNLNQNSVRVTTIRDPRSRDEELRDRNRCGNIYQVSNLRSQWGKLSRQIKDVSGTYRVYLMKLFFFFLSCQRKGLSFYTINLTHNIYLLFIALSFFFMSLIHRHPKVYTTFTVSLVILLSYLISHLPQSC